MRQAVTSGIEEFVVFYQPVVDVRTGECSSCEALVRWDSKALGFMGPGDFIPLAEYLGLITSIGDYVLTGGELPALILVDAIARLIPGVLNQNESFEDESFENDLLEYPHYTRPREFMGLNVPDVLLSGNHQKIEAWRKEQAIEITKKRRKDLYKKYCKK